MSAGEQSLGGLPIASGDILLGKYRVEEIIGQGGTGVVVSAIHVPIGQKVAIKFLRRALASDELRTRFEREARAAGRIESEHVVLVLDAGALEDGSPFMVMEHLDGRDLARVLKEDGPLSVEQAVDCMLQVCAALAEAHAHGIVHRDLKPANLFLTRRTDGRVHVKVVDFGIAKILDKKLLEHDGKAQDVTTAHTVLGSPRYMAPEQVRNSKEVDGRADLWSIGAVLFQLLTGKHAFAADGNVQASVAVLTAEPESLRALAPHVPPGLEDVVMRCLTKDVDARVQTAGELAEALLPYASREGRASFELLRLNRIRTGQGRDAPTERRIRTSPAGSSTAVATVTLGSGAARGSVSSRRSPLVWLGAVTVALLIAFGLAVTRGRRITALSRPALTGTVRFTAQRSDVGSPSFAAPSAPARPDRVVGVAVGGHLVVGQRGARPAPVVAVPLDAGRPNP